MIIISSRKNFWDADEMQFKHDIKHINLDIPETLPNSMSEDDFLTNVKDKRILLLVHGYNTNAKDVADAYKKIEAHINVYAKNQYDLILGYAWAGGDDFYDYFSAKTRADATSPLFRRLLEQISNEASCLDVMTHSMGARLTLAALQNAERKTVRNLFTMAAAVNDESIQFGEKYYGATAQCQTIYVFHSKDDAVLRVWYKLSEKQSNALGYSGVESPAIIIEHSQNIKVVDCKSVVHGHSEYKCRDQIYQHIQNELAGIPSLQFVTL
jgi:esterase/lipase superfamily enzyme